MRQLLLQPIRFYWHAWPHARRRCCVFRESCSRYVHRVTTERGLWAGLQALLQRFRGCRGGYTITATAVGLGLRLADGTTITHEEASPTVLAPYYGAAASIQQTCNARP